MNEGGGVNVETRPKGLFAVDKFFERTPDGPVLVGSRCTECGRVVFPRKKVCAKCFRNDSMEVHPLAKHGEIVTYSISHMSHIGMETPYAFGYVYLPEDNITIYTLFTDWDPPEERLFIGQQVEQYIDVFREDPWGNSIITYLYRCVGTKSDLEAAKK
jgi:uncharacterized OB-fold protein